MPSGSDFHKDFPWLGGPWAVLHAYLAAGRVPHALLVHGPAGSGKGRLARTFAQRLLCMAAGGEFACGQCSACRLLDAGTHPDFVVVEPDEPGKALKADAVREKIASLALRPQYAHSRVVLLPDAHLLNRHASSSLLKTLEEPDPQTRFLLLADNPGAVPATIRSRCQRIPVKLPPREMTAEWLRGQSPPVTEVEARIIVARGAPLRALALDASRVAVRCGILEGFSELATGSADPVDVAGRWEKFGSDDAVSCLISWLEDLIRLRSAPGARATNNPDFADALRALAGRPVVARLYACLDLAYRAKRQLTGQLNRLLLLEELAIACSGMAHDQAFRGESDRDER